MTRLGELLLAARVVTPAQVASALRAQVVWGGRLGTNLVELGATDLDTLARALGRQRNLLAALARHFENADRTLQTALPAELAARWAVVPLVALSNGTIAVAALDPLDAAATAAIAAALGVPPARLVVAIAPELRVRYHLERVYHISRDSRFVRARGPTISPFPTDVPIDDASDPDLEIPIDIDGDDAVPEPAPADELTIPIDLGDVIEEATPLPPSRPRTDPGRERRTYVKTLGDDDAVPEPPSEPESTQPLGRLALRRVAAQPDVPRVVERAPSAPASLADATRAIRRGVNRERVGDLVIETIENYAPSCAAAAVLILRGNVAFGWRWFSRAGRPQPELAVPLASPGVVPNACRTSATARAAARELADIDRLLHAALGGSGDLAVVPIAIGKQVICVIAAATVAPDAPISGIEAIASAAGVAFARLMRDASR